MDSIKEIQEVDAAAHPHDEETPEELQLPEVEQNIQDLQDLLEVDEDSDNIEAKNIVDQTIHAAEESEEDEDEDMEDAEKPEEKVEEESDEDESEEEEKEHKEEKTVKKEEKKALGTRVQDEIQLMLRERQDISEQEHDNQYYENQLLTKKDDSYVWIHYISFAYKQGGIEEARKICERGVKTIDMTNLREKLNLWIAYMNLEFSYGSE